jgi:uncharacterized OsmC-like protein
MSTDMMTFAVAANRIDATGSKVQSKQVELLIDTGMAGRPDALNPVELLLAALSACIIKGIERVAGSLGIEYDSVNVSLTAHRPVDEARIDDIAYVIRIGTSADQAKLELLHKNLMKFGTIYNTIKSGTTLSGTISREGGE